MKYIFGQKDCLFVCQSLLRFYFKVILHLLLSFHQLLLHFPCKDFFSKHFNFSDWSKEVLWNRFYPLSTSLIWLFVSTICKFSDTIIAYLYQFLHSFSIFCTLFNFMICILHNVSTCCPLSQNCADFHNFLPTFSKLCTLY